MVLSYLASGFGACARVPNVSYKAVLEMTADDRVSREVAMARAAESNRSAREGDVELGAVPVDRPVAALGLPDPDDVPLPVNPGDVPEAMIVASPTAPAMGKRI